jgi:tRNA pseudouridine38-40 synthase
MISSRLEGIGEELVYTVEGSGFLHHMVRNMVGTLLWVGRGSMRPARITDILIAKDRSLAGPTAPARGLHLVQVNYAGARPGSCGRTPDVVLK